MHLVLLIVSLQLPGHFPQNREKKIVVKIITVLTDSPMCCMGKFVLKKNIFLYTHVFYPTKFRFLDFERFRTLVP